jgi:hypothetical protein
MRVTTKLAEGDVSARSIQLKTQTLAQAGSPKLPANCRSWDARSAPPGNFHSIRDTTARENGKLHASLRCGTSKQHGLNKALFAEINAAPAATIE